MARSKKKVKLNAVARSKRKVRLNTVARSKRCRLLESEKELVGQYQDVFGGPAKTLREMVEEVGSISLSVSI